MAKINAGDQVQYSRNFLRSIGAVASADDLGHLCGTVVEIKECPARARVQWDHEPELKSALLSNLKVVGKPEIE